MPFSASGDQSYVPVSDCQLISVCFTGIVDNASVAMGLVTKDSAHRPATDLFTSTYVDDTAIAAFQFDNSNGSVSVPFEVVRQVQVPVLAGEPVLVSINKNSESVLVAITFLFS